MKATRYGSLIAALTIMAACADRGRPPGPGFELRVAQLDLVGIDVACYDLLASGAAGDVWGVGDPNQGADQGDASICSDVFGNGPGGDIAYVGPCDASPGADTDPDEPGVQNSVTVWFDGLYTGSSATGLTPIPGVSQTITGTCNPNASEWSFCAWPNLPDWPGLTVPGIYCLDDSVCAFQATAPAWQDPCGPSGCTLEFDCNENQDTRVDFDFTVMRNAQQGFFDVAVNFEDIFCSAKYDTCYDVGSGAARPIELLFGADDGERNHTGVMGLACTADPNASAATVVHRSEIWVWCDAWDHFWVLDPSAGPGNVQANETFDLLDDPTSTPLTLRYATYWGTEALDCGAGAGSCNKVYWNVAIDLEHLFDQGLRDCHMATIATASASDESALTDGELLQSGSYYPIIDFGGMDGDWTTGLPLVGASDIPCVANGLNAPGSLVRTDYAATGDISADDAARYLGPIWNDYGTWLCHEMTAGAVSPTPDPECLARLCAMRPFSFCP